MLQVITEQNRDRRHTMGHIIQIKNRLLVSWFQLQHGDARMNTQRETPPDQGTTNVHLQSHSKIAKGWQCTAGKPVAIVGENGC